MASFKFCPSCGVETEGTKFCVECGADLRREAYGPAAVEAAPKKKGSEKGQASGPASGAEPVPEGVPEGKSEAKKSISDVTPIRVAPVAEDAGGADADGTAEVGRWPRERKLAGGCAAGVIVIVIGFATVVLASGASDGSSQAGSSITGGAAGGPCLTNGCAKPTSPNTETVTQPRTEGASPVTPTYVKDCYGNACDDRSANGLDNVKQEGTPTTSIYAAVGDAFSPVSVGQSYSPDSVGIGHVCQFSFKANDLYAFAYVPQQGTAVFQFVNTAGWALLLKNWQLPEGVDWKDENGTLMARASAMGEQCPAGGASTQIDGSE